MQKRLSCVMDIGEQMLLCGAEVHRVEDSMERMCLAFGAKRVDVFSITSSLVVTVFTEEDSYTETRRITGTGTDLERLHRLNHLSRKICAEKLTLEEIKEEYEKCLAGKSYPFWLVWLSYGMIAASFTAFLAEWMARLLKTPTTTFLMTTLIPLVPGASLYYTMAYALGSDMEKFIQKAISTLKLAGALALGIVIATMIVKIMKTKGDKQNGSIKTISCD